MNCPHCGTDTPAGAARCATCGAPRAAAADVTLAPGELDVTGGFPASAAFETIGGGTPAAGTGTHQLGLDVTRVGAVAATRATGISATGTGTARQFTMLTPGQTLGVRYHIIRLLGVGGMGAVYHAWDAELGVAVALKVIRGDITGDPDAAAAIERQFKRELLLARQVTHKHVVRIHDLGDIDGIKYITMPYVQGADLASVLKESGTLPVPRTLRYISQIVGGLVAAHDAGVVHRDLKPANIMIDEDDQALIMDFGIAHSSSAAGTGADKVVGTLAYMAPEQAQAKPTDQRADVYALGMMLREMLVGRKPSGDGQQALADLMARIKDAPPRLRTVDETIPEPLDALAAKCVEPDPANRFQTSAELAAALAALDEDGTLRPLPRAVLSPWRMTVAAVLVVATIGVAAVVVRKTTPPAAPKTIEPVSILVADFENKTGDAVFDGALEQPLTIAMEGASFVSTYPRNAALQVARDVQHATRLDLPAARLVALRDGIKFVLSASIGASGSGYTLRLDAIDLAGKTAQSATVSAKSKEDVLNAVATLATRMRRSLGDTAASAKADGAETFTAASLDAMREYSLAQDVQFTGQDASALDHYQKAIALDPKFGRAYSGAANMTYRLGRRDDAEALWKQSFALMDRMTEREKFRTLGAYYLAIAENYEKAAENYAALVKAFPADSTGHNNLALSSFMMRNFAKANEEGRKAVELAPQNLSYRSNYALYAMYAGEFERAATDGRALVKQRPTLHKAYLPVAAAALMRNDLPAVAAAYDQMATASPSGASLAELGRADLALYSGRGKELEAALRAAIAADVTAKNTTGGALKQIALAEALASAGKTAAAAKAAGDALALTRQVATLVPAARVYLRVGKAGEARAIATELERSLQKQTRAYGKIILAEAAIGAKDMTGAIDLLGQARELADLWLGRFDLGVAYVQAEHFAEAVPELEACEKRRGEATALFFDDYPTMRFLAPLPYWLGRAQEGLGMTAPAKTHYAAFLSLRKDGAADPLVDDARRRSARP
jgi:eukaryotic-like serine/threonine-protein kinase